MLALVVSRCEQPSSIQEFCTYDRTKPTAAQPGALLEALEQSLLIILLLSWKLMCRRHAWPGRCTPACNTAVHNDPCQHHAWLIKQ